MANFSIAILMGLLFSFIFSPFIFKFCNLLKAKQTILHYVEVHKTKNGTPTMGGLIFLFGITFASILLLTKNCSLATISLASMLGFGLLGFLDDFIKVKYKQNKGLSALQKIIGQLGLSLIIAYFAYNSALVGDQIFIPFFNIYVNLGVGAIPFYVLVFVAITNSVNLIDGLDGLASGVSLTYIIFFSAILMILSNTYLENGINLVQLQENNNLIILCGITIGALITFLVFNGFPAKIFMGDTGSLGLGGLIAGITILSKNSIILPILGVMFLITAISVIMQVAYFKRTKKRIFLMAPYHHHLQLKGLHENKILFIYITITLIMGCILISTIKF